MAGWNHRVLVFPDGDDHWFQIHSVYYDDMGKPNAYGVPGAKVGGNSREELVWELSMMLACLDKPWLWGGDRFPEEYKIEDHV